MNNNFMNQHSLENQLIYYKIVLYKNRLYIIIISLKIFYNVLLYKIKDLVKILLYKIYF